FRTGSDHFEISGSGLKLEVEPGKWLAVPPRLALPAEGDQAVIRLDRLRALTADAGDPALTHGNPRMGDSRAVPGEAAFSIDGGPPVPWNAIVDALPPAGLDLLGDAGLLLRLGLLTAEQASKALEQARPDEPLDMALSRLGMVSLDTWVDAVIGRSFIPSSSARPFGDRLGMRLLARRAITQGQLKKALEAQAADPGPHRPLGQLLGVAPGVLDAALESQAKSAPMVAEADGLGEVLIRWGCVSRTDWLRAQRAGADPAQALVKAGKLLPSHVLRAKAYREALVRHLTVRSVRLGHILLERPSGDTEIGGGSGHGSSSGHGSGSGHGSSSGHGHSPSRGQGLDRATLAKALAWQVDQHMPLAELLVLHRLIGPGDAARTIGEQAAQYRHLAEAGLPPLEVRRPEPARVGVPQRPRRRFPREYAALAAFGVFMLVYAIAYNQRLAGRDFGWLNAFFPRTPAPAAVYRPPGGEVHGVSLSRGATGPITVERVDRLDLPLRGPLARLEPGQTTAGAIQPAQNLDEAGPAGTPGPGTGARPGETFAPPAIPVAAIGTPNPATPEAAASAEGLAQIVPSLGPQRRFPAPAFGDRTREAAHQEASFPPMEGGKVPGLGRDKRFSYPMERPLVLATPPPPTPEPGDEPAAMKKFRADLARLRTAEARHRRTGQTLRAEGREADAQRALALAETVRRSQSVFRVRIGEAYYRAGDRVAAASELRGAAHDDPTFALPHYFLGSIARDRGDRAGAVAAWRHYLALAPEGEYAPEAREGLAAYGEKL
ncbi:MAG: hypothetical protein FJZ00_07835, partial [Candidatus Sericytochromatia bacterium]|nr:hypothetical protein [Candidatus Tanganyikabacteria bacterium]